MEANEWGSYDVYDRYHLFLENGAKGLWMPKHMCSSYFPKPSIINYKLASDFAKDKTVLDLG